MVSDLHTEAGLIADLNDRIAELEAAIDEVVQYIAELEAAQRWMPIDTAPHDGQAIWLGAPTNIRIGFWMRGEQYEHHGSKGGGWRDLATSRGLYFRPTKWKRLPEAPEHEADQ